VPRAVAPRASRIARLHFVRLRDTIGPDMDRTLVILRHTFREAVAQPIYLLLLVLGAVILIIFGMLPFFTLSEDTVMFKLVGLDVIRLLVLVATLFATSRCIYEEIEDRTMLTLMAKPVGRLEVLLGKYLGIILAAGLMLAALGVVMAMATWWRIPGDYLIRVRTIDAREAAELAGIRWMHLAGLLPALLLDWMQIAVLAAIGVALSVRAPLVVNLPVVIVLYIICNLTRFLHGAGRDSAAVRAFAWVASTVLPALDLFDIREQLVQQKLAVAQFASEPGALALGAAWQYVAGAGVYAAVYIAFVLGVGMWLFQQRELGGAEG
jgi:hypothetical protein